MSEVTAKDLRDSIQTCFGCLEYDALLDEKSQLELEAELAAFDALVADAEVGRRMKALTSKNGFWLSCLDGKVLIGKRTKTWLGDDLVKALKAVPDE